MLKLSILIYALIEVGFFFPCQIPNSIFNGFCMFAYLAFSLHP